VGSLGLAPKQVQIHIEYYVHSLVLQMLGYISDEFTKPDRNVVIDFTEMIKHHQEMWARELAQQTSLWRSQVKKELGL
jgi:hypothetical protein